MVQNNGSIRPPQGLRRLTSSSDTMAWDTIALAVYVIFAYSLVVYAVQSNHLSYSYGTPLLGIVVHHAYYVEHEAVHGNIAGGKALDHILGTIAAGLHLESFQVHKKYHLKHHAHTNDSLDPDAVLNDNFWTVFGLVLIGVPGSFITPIPYIGPWVLGKFAARARAQGVNSVDADFERIIENLPVRQYYYCVFMILVAVFGWKAPTLLWMIPHHIGNIGRIFVAGWLPHAHQSVGRFHSTRLTRFTACGEFIEACVSVIVFGGHDYHALHHLYPRVPALRLATLYREVGVQEYLVSVGVEGA